MQVVLNIAAVRILEVFAQPPITAALPPIHYAEHWSLQHLRLNDWGLHSNDRLLWKGNLALPHSIDIAGEFHCAEVFAELPILLSRNKFLIEALRLASKRLYHLQNLLHSGDHRPVVVVRCLSEEEVEDGNLILHTIIVEGFAHCILIFVGTVTCFQVHDNFFINIQR